MQGTGLSHKPAVPLENPDKATQAWEGRLGTEGNLQDTSQASEPGSQGAEGGCLSALLEMMLGKDVFQVASCL